MPKRKQLDAEQAAQEKTVAMTPYSIELDEDGLKITLNIVDTPGFGDNIDNEANFQSIMKYVERQYDEVLTEEARIKRNPKFQGKCKVFGGFKTISSNCFGL